MQDTSVPTGNSTSGDNRAPDPVVSVVMPTYQRRDVVVESVSALRRQATAAPFEVVVVVDGSSDGTSTALAALPVEFPLTVIEQANAGAASARNTGWRIARGRIVLFLDDDMEAEPDLIAWHVAAHDAGADAVSGAIGPHPDSHDSMLTDSVDAWYTSFAEQMRTAARDLRFDEVITGQLSLRRDVLEALDGFDERFSAGGVYGNEDIDLGHRLLAGGYRIVCEPQALSRQRYVVSAAAHLRQYRQAGRADVVLARKYPELAGGLFDRKRAASPIHRRVWRPALAAPRLIGALHALAAPVVTRLVDRGRRGGPLWWAYFILRETGYWLGVADAGGMPRHTRLRVLCYHAVADLRGDPVLAAYGVPPAVLADQLDTLRRAGCSFVSGEELVRFLDGRGGLPRRAVLVTFDDCYASLLSDGVPVLRERGIPAVAFAVSGALGGTNDWDARRGARSLPLLDAAGLAALARHDVEIGAHGRRHRPVALLADGEVSHEVVGAVDDLHAAGLPRPRLLAYPHGSHDQRARSSAARGGLRGAFTVEPGIVTAGTDRYALPRLEIFPGDVGLRLTAKVLAAGVAAPFMGALRRTRRRARTSVGVARALRTRRRPA